jgi:hypothetical protein
MEIKNEIFDLALDINLFVDYIYPFAREKIGLSVEDFIFTTIVAIETNNNNAKMIREVLVTADSFNIAGADKLLGRFDEIMEVKHEIYK